MKKTLIFFGFLLLLGVAFAPGVDSSVAAEQSFAPIYMTVAGIIGESITPDRVTAHTKVYSMNHEVSATLSSGPAGGWSVGDAKHGVLTVTKAVDSTSPQLYEMLIEGTTAETVYLRFFRTYTDGTQRNYYTINLIRARVVSMKSHFPLTFLGENSEYKHLEDVSFTYEAIRWFHEGAIEYSTTVTHVIV